MAEVIRRDGLTIFFDVYFEAEPVSFGFYADVEYADILLRENCGLPRRKSSGIFQAGTLPLREVIFAVIKNVGGELRIPGPLFEREPFFPL